MNAIVRPIALPHLSRADADRANRLARCRAPLPLPGNEAFSLVPLDDAADRPTQIADRLAIELAFGRHRLRATMPQQLVLDLLRSLDSTLRLDPLPPADLAALLLEAALLPLVEALERGLGVPAAIETVAAMQEGGAGDLTSSGYRTASAPQGQALVALSGPGLHQLLTLDASPNALDRLLRGWPHGRRRLDGLTFQARLLLGSTRLTLSGLRSLRPGDAVLFEHSTVSLDRGGAASVLRLAVSDSLQATLRADGTRWRLDTPLGPLAGMGQVLNEDGADQAPAAASMQKQLDDLPVLLVFEAGRIDLPLGVLQTLGVGSLLDIGGAPGMVRITANGQRFGSGELVSVDGRPAVRITDFKNGGEPSAYPDAPGEGAGA